MNMDSHRKAEHYQFFLCVVLHLTVLINISTAASASLFFKDTVLINDSIMTLSDLATVSSQNSELLMALKKASAGQTAPPGYSRFVNSRDLVLYRLQAAFPDVDFSFTGADRILVRTDFSELRVGDYSREIHDYLESVIKWGKDTWKLTIENPGESWKCLKAPVIVTPGGAEQGYPKGRTVLTLLVEQGSRKTRVPVRCNIEVVIPVVVLTNQVVRGQEITTAACEIRRFDITHFGPLPYRSLDQVFGMRAARTLAPGTVLHDRLVQAIPLVDKGDLVQILVQKGRVKVAVSGIARESGGPGERIWVENSSSRKLMRVTVKEKGVCILTQGGMSI